MTHGMGWLKEPTDNRDYDLPPKLVKNSKEPAKYLPKSYIIPREKFTPIKDQGMIGSCTAFAACGIMEYFVKQKVGYDIDLSELFLYLETRRELGWEKEDSGAYLRTVMKALVSVGVCEEQYWPYKESKFTDDPPAHVYPRSDDFQATHYYKIDHMQYSKPTQLLRLKTAIAFGLPCIMGFSVYGKSIGASENNGDIEYPASSDYQSGGHAVIIYGYDDEYEITNSITGNVTKGAFTIRNSWGESWGDKGYGAIPYKYFKENELSDIWCMYNAEYLDSKKFE